MFSDLAVKTVQNDQSVNPYPMYNQMGMPIKKPGKVRQSAHNFKKQDPLKQFQEVTFGAGFQRPSTSSVNSYSTQPQSRLIATDDLQKVDELISPENEHRSQPTQQQFFNLRKCDNREYVKRYEQRKNLRSTLSTFQRRDNNQAEQKHNMLDIYLKDSGMRTIDFESKAPRKQRQRQPQQWGGVRSVSMAERTISDIYTGQNNLMRRYRGEIDTKQKTLDPTENRFKRPVESCLHARIAKSAQQRNKNRAIQEALGRIKPQIQDPHEENMQNTVIEEMLSHRSCSGRNEKQAKNIINIQVNNRPQTSIQNVEPEVQWAQNPRLKKRSGSSSLLMGRRKNTIIKVVEQPEMRLSNEQTFTLAAYGNEILQKAAQMTKQMEEKLPPVEVVVAVALEEQEQEEEEEEESEVEIEAVEEEEEKSEAEIEAVEQEETVKELEEEPILEVQSSTSEEEEDESETESMPVVRVKRRKIRIRKALLDSALVGTRKADQDLVSDKLKFQKRMEFEEMSKDKKQNIVERYFGNKIQSNPMEFSQILKAIDKPSPVKVRKLTSVKKQPRQSISPQSFDMDRDEVHDLIKARPTSAASKSVFSSTKSISPNRMSIEQRRRMQKQVDAINAIGDEYKQKGEVIDREMAVDKNNQRIIDKKVKKLMTDDRQIRQDLSTYEAHMSGELNLKGKLQACIEATKMQRATFLELAGGQKPKMSAFLDEVTDEFKESVSYHDAADPKLKIRQERFMAIFYRMIWQKVEVTGQSSEMYNETHKTEPRYKKFYEYFVKD